MANASAPNPNPIHNVNYWHCEHCDWKLRMTHRTMLSPEKLAGIDPRYGWHVLAKALNGNDIYTPPHPPMAPGPERERLLFCMEAGKWHYWLEHRLELHNEVCIPGTPQWAQAAPPADWAGPAPIELILNASRGPPKPQ